MPKVKGLTHSKYNCNCWIEMFLTRNAADMKSSISVNRLGTP